MYIYIEKHLHKQFIICFFGYQLSDCVFFCLAPESRVFMGFFVIVPL